MPKTYAAGSLSILGGIGGFSGGFKYSHEILEYIQGHIPNRIFDYAQKYLPLNHDILFSNDNRAMGTNLVVGILVGGVLYKVSFMLGKWVDSFMDRRQEKTTQQRYASTKNVVNDLRKSLEEKVKHG